jgi:hypothetical protein
MNICATLPSELFLVIGGHADERTRRTLRVVSRALDQLLTSLVFSTFRLHLRDGAPHQKVSALCSDARITQLASLIRTCILECDTESVEMWRTWIHPSLTCMLLMISVADPSSVVDGLRILEAFPGVVNLQLQVQGMHDACLPSAHALSALIMRLSAQLPSLPFGHLQVFHGECDQHIYRCGPTISMLNCPYRDGYTAIPSWAYLCPLHITNIALDRIYLDRTSFQGIMQLAPLIHQLSIHDSLIDLGMDACSAPRWSILWDWLSRRGSFLVTLTADGMMYGRVDWGSKGIMSRLDPRYAPELSCILAEDSGSLKTLQGKLDREANTF